jgi:hypothetical protein
MGAGKISQIGRVAAKGGEHRGTFRRFGKARLRFAERCKSLDQPMGGWAVSGGGPCAGAESKIIHLAARTG